MLFNSLWGQSYIFFLKTNKNLQKSDIKIFGGFAEIFVKDILVGLRP
jgi:cell shape-determining protein MreC